MELSTKIIEDNSTFTQIEVAGGNNGNPDWENYLKTLIDCITLFKEKYNTEKVILQDLNTDVLYKAFYANFLVYKNN